MTRLIRSSSTLAAAVLAFGLAGCGAAPPAAGPVPTTTPTTIVTEADSGHTIDLATGQTAALRLSRRYAWSEPKAGGGAVSVRRAAGAGSPTYEEWTITAQRRGTATVTASGRPACAPGTMCPAVILAFSLTVAVN